jgi:toxin secretion/phage lysis holin
MIYFSDVTVHPLIAPIVDYLKALPLISTLSILMALDMCMGIGVAVVKKTLNSTVSFRGMTKKVFMLILVAAGATLEPFAQGLPVARMIAMAYIITETISLTENAAAIGVPIPQALQDILLKLREDQQKKVQQKAPPIARMEIPMAPDTDTVVTVTKTPVQSGAQTPPTEPK